MHCKKATLVINPRTGENVAKITDVLAVLAAAGWETTIALKEYGGHTLKLAQQASADDSDLVIAYGGDGTLNQVVNGVMTTKKPHSSVAVIPGGTANVWAGEIGIPTDPVKAVLALVNSEARKVDVGHVAVQVPTPTNDAVKEGQDEKKGRKKKQKVSEGSKKAKHHFLLMAGLGIDAAIMEGVSKPLKYRVGPLAVGLSAAKELPAHHAFPMEIRATETEREGEILWKGDALQVVIGNTRRYADIAEMTPDAYIDDGVLNVCVITGGNPLSTMQQVASLLLRRKPDNLSAEYFHGVHLQITVPASVPLQLDGSAVKLKDYLAKSEYATLQQVGDMEHTMVTYHFDAIPHALKLAIPRTYNDALFEHESGHDNEQVSAEREHEYVNAVANSHSHNGEEGSQVAVQERTEVEKSHEQEQEHKHGHEESSAEQKDLPELVGALLENGRKVTVVGWAPNADKQGMYVIAGGTVKASTGETRPVAVVVNDKTTVYNHQGDKLAAKALEELREGATIVVEGDKSKRGVIAATRLIM